MGQWLKRILVLLLLLVGVGVAGFYHLIHRSDSAVDGTVLVEGVSQPVRIIRDVYGVPHIFAQDRKDLAFALGYVQAQDRLWQLDMGRHLGSGTLSEVFGPVSLALDTDLFFRTVFSRPDRKEFLRRVWEAISPEVREELEAFTRGVNTFVTLHPGKLPLEFWLTGHQFEPLEVVAEEALAGNPLAWALSLNFSDEVLATKIAGRLDPSLLSELFPEAPTTVLPGEAGAQSRSVVSTASGITPPWSGPSFAGLSRDSLSRLSRDLAAFLLRIPGMNSRSAAASNSWVVGGERTTTGKPILANDPHLDIPMPSIWYEVHLVAPGVDVIGAAVPGLPYVSIGHNRCIAWGITAAMADNQDLFVERVNPENPRQVWFVDHWEDMKVEKISIPVKGQTALEKEILSSRHGPVITPIVPGLKETLAVQWALSRVIPDNVAKDLEGIRMLNTAANWKEFREAVQNSTLSLNMMYADVDGNIGWQVTGTIPVRAKGDGRFPVPGWTGEDEWTGLIPFEALPSYYLPAGSAGPQVTGSLVSSTPTHVIATANQRTVHSDYKHTISHTWVPPYRFLRISQLLGQKEKISVQDMQRYQADQHPLLADILVQILEEVEGNTTDLRWALSTLQQWDRQVSRDSTAATLYELTLVHLMKNAYADELGDLYNDYAWRFGVFYTGLDALLHQPQAKWWDDVRTPTVETRKDILRRSLQDAMADARQRLGSDPARWRWGDLHRAVFAHPLGRGWPLDWLLNRSVPSGGDGHTVNVGYYRLNQPFDVVAAPSFRMVVDLSDIAHAYAMNTTGQSGRPLTPHYDDMIQSWVTVQYHSMWMNEEDIATHAEGTLVLTPSSGSQ